MSKREITNEKLNSECEVDEDSNSAVSPNHPYSTKQFNNWLYSNKGKVFSHDLPLFHIERVKENWGSIESSVEEISIIYVSQKKIKKWNHKLIDFKNLNSVKVQKIENYSAQQWSLFLK